MKIKNQELIKKFKNFIWDIKKNDKVGIIYHADPDGICSAVILANLIKRIKKRGADYAAYISHISQLKEAIKYMKKKKIDKLIFTDLSVDQISNMKEIKPFSKVLILDHHKLYKNINLENTILIKPQMIYSSINPGLYCSSKLCFDLGNKVTSLKDLDWIASIGIIGDSGYNYWKSFVDGVFRKYKIRKTSKLRESELHKITKIMFHSIAYNLKNTETCYEVLLKSKSHKEAIPSKLQRYNKMIKKEIKYWNSNVKRLAEVYPKLELVFDSIKPKYFINPSIIETISNKHPNKTIVIAQDMNKDIINISARRADGKIAVNELLERSIKNLHGANAGGHIKSAGGIIQKKDFFKFKDNVFRLLSSSYPHSSN